MSAFLQRSAMVGPAEDAQYGNSAQVCYRPKADVAKSRTMSAISGSVNSETGSSLLSGLRCNSPASKASYTRQKSFGHGGGGSLNCFLIIIT